VALIYLSLGSNVERYLRITAALDALTERFGELTLSSVYESNSVGFQGDNFLNLVAGIYSESSLGEVSIILKQMENDNGRDRSAPHFGPRSLDIDILTMDNVSGEVDGIELPRDEVLKNAFVLLPLAEIAPDTNHPITGQSYAEHWQCYDKSKQKLWPVPFTWQGKNLTA
jgi:2-amino-4-hydroxy-6-hydroxymethyldihydropteridine diphosphokinase